MKTIYTTALALMLGTTFYSAEAQSYQAMQGTPLREVKPADVEGSPFLDDDWHTVSVVTDKTTYTNLKAKYDLYHDQLVVAGPKNEPLQMSEEVKKFYMDNATYASGFPPIGANNRKSFYMVLSGGKVKLLKHLGKMIQENKAYGAATVTREFRNTQNYFVVKNDEIKQVKADKKEILAVLSDKGTEMNTYLGSHKINFKNDKDLAQLFDYYNGL